MQRPMNKTLFCTINWIRLDEKDLMIDNIVQKKSFPTVMMLHSISPASNNHISSKNKLSVEIARPTYNLTHHKSSL